MKRKYNKGEKITKGKGAFLNRRIKTINKKLRDIPKHLDNVTYQLIIVYNKTKYISTNTNDIDYDSKNCTITNNFNIETEDESSSDDEEINYYKISKKEWKEIYSDKEYPEEKFQNLERPKNEKEKKEHQNYLNDLKIQEKSPVIKKKYTKRIK
jgi:hypothetical protein